MNTKDKLIKILTEWREFVLPPYYVRDFNYSLLDDNEILSIIGTRRAGKTYLCYQIVNELRKRVPAENILFINLEDERLAPMSNDELSLLLDVYFELFNVNHNQRIYLLIDEIQNAKKWEKWVRRISEQNKNIKLIITGSSSKLLSREIATELRGRSISFSVFPLNFKEFLAANKISSQIPNLRYGKENLSIKKSFTSFLRLGGFPAALSSSNPDELLKEYYRAMYYRDIIDRHKVKNIKLLEDYLTLIFDQISALFSISSTANKLQEFGHSFSKNTLSNFSKYAKEAFLTFEVSKFSYKVKEQLRNPKKIYIIDHALASAVRFSFSEDIGKKLENIVFLALVQQKLDIFYHHEKKECDFILSDRGKVIGAMQVCRSISETKTKEREIAGLIEAMDKFHLDEGLILTEDQYDNFEIDHKLIHVMPVWHWLIESKP